MKIHGIECGVVDPVWLEAIELVLGTIDERFPNDFEVIRRKVLAIVPKSTSPASWRVTERGCLKALRTELKHALDEDQERFDRINRILERVENLELDRGVVELCEGAVGDNLTRAVAAVAHELGHVMTTGRDHKCREYWNLLAVGKAVADAIANMYAFRWGFEREIREDQSFHHHPLPGDKQEIQPGVWYQITPDFHLKRVEGDSESQSAPPKEEG